MKSLAQLKRDLQPGVMVKTIIQTVKPEKVGQERPILKTQTNAIVFKEDNASGESWLWWPKANMVEYDGDKFRIFYEDYHTKARTLAFEYQIMA